MNLPRVRKIENLTSSRDCGFLNSRNRLSTEKSYQNGFSVDVLMPPSTKKKLTAPFSPELSLNTACVTYLKRRTQYLKPRSLEAYQYHFKTLRGFFDPAKRLSSFHEEDLRRYQAWRTKSGAGPSLINHELGALSQLLSLADLWHPISKYYERLPERNWTPTKVLTAEQEERFFRFATRNQEWKTAYNAARITSNSTVSGCELRTLRLEHLALLHTPPIIYLPDTVKNRHRVRGVPLNDIALCAVKELLVLAKERGSNQPDHYLIAFRIKRGQYDPCRPASSCFIRSSFRAIAKASGLEWITPTTFRHQAITKLLESGAPDETVRAIAGHVSEKAMQYYSHIRIKAKSEAVNRLVAAPQRSASAQMSKEGSLSRMVMLREAALRLGVSPDVAFELVLEYERSKSLGR
jgi:integrase